MGGRKGAMKSYVDSKTVMICETCHSAIHMRHDIASDGFCCDRCPMLKNCFFGARLLGRPYSHLSEPWKNAESPHL
jgi:hypothetical protein